MLLPSVSGKRTIAGFAFHQGTYGKLKVGAPLVALGKES